MEVKLDNLQDIKDYVFLVNRLEINKYRLYLLENNLDEFDKDADTIKEQIKEDEKKLSLYKK